MLAAFCVCKSDMPEELPVISDSSRWLAVYSRKLEAEIAGCFDRFRDRGLEPVLIKGWAAARNYPPNVPRRYTDVDLAFSANQFEEARRIVRSDAHFPYNVDLHRELKHLDSVPWADIFERSQVLDLNGCQVRVPSDEDHLRIMATHWLNDGGERKEKLLDIYYAVANRPPEFDWDVCLNAVGANRRAWVIIAIGAAHRYLGLEISDLPFRSEAALIPGWIAAKLEREWKSETRLRPLAMVSGEPRQLVAQLLKRFPPNPIQATIEMDGDLRGRRRLLYQLGSIKRRLVPSLTSFKHRLAGESE